MHPSAAQHIMYANDSHDVNNAPPAFRAYHRICSSRAPKEGEAAAEPIGLLLSVLCHNNPSHVMSNERGCPAMKLRFGNLLYDTKNKHASAEAQGMKENITFTR